MGWWVTDRRARGMCSIKRWNMRDGDTNLLYMLYYYIVLIIHGSIGTYPPSGQHGGNVLPSW
jgi:hypothetical protein